MAELALFALLATLHTWPLATDPAHLTRLDNDDAAFNTWVIAWVAHQLPRDPQRLFEAPIFHPAHEALAFSEHMLVPALLGAPLQWAGVSPVLVYNILVWAGLTLSGFSLCVVMRRWTGSGIAGVVAGSAYAFNAHLLTRFSHLQALHVEFLPVVLFAFDRLLSTKRTRWAALLAVAFLLQALCSNYTMVFLATALGTALLVRPEPWTRGSLRLWLALAGAALVAGGALVPFLLPYYRVRLDQGLVRTIDDVRLYSAGWLDYLVTAGRIHFSAWSHYVFEHRTALFPGLTASALAAMTVISGVALRDRRARMALAFSVVGFALSFGANLPGYAWLHEHVPLLQGIRAAARWGFLALTGIGILAGFGVSWLQNRVGRTSVWPAIAIGLVGLVTLEALRAPLSLRRFDGLASVHRRLARAEVHAIVVFPLYGGDRFNRNAMYLLDQTAHWKPMINGYSSFAPSSFFERAARLQSFPDAASIAELRSVGVSHIVLHRAPLEETFGAAALASLRAHPDLEFVVEQTGVIVYRLRPEGPG
ncbi:MAG: hypothetical protein ACT4QD_20960 [Acidobacteriota bacterium]